MPFYGTTRKFMTKLAIFDLDGTLIDTLEDIACACNHALEAGGFPPRRLDEYNMLVGRGVLNLCRYALPEGKRDEETVRATYERFVAYYDRHLCDRSKPYPGICSMLDRLTEKGISLAVASNKYQRGTEFLISRLFGRYSFVSVLGQREGRPIKPDPEIVNEAMAAMKGVSVDEVVYCGDSDVDMQTGRNAGVRTVGVTWGFRSREELAAYDPWLIADNAEELCNAILNN